MQKMFLALLLGASLSFGFGINGDLAREMRVLKELDISLTYLNDPHYLLHKDSISQSAKEALVGVIRDRSNEVALIKKIISDAGLPRPLLYLAVVESKLSAKATSRAKAVGIWQFVEKTAKNFGLRVDRYVDERRDPVESTIAAMDYLSDMKGRLGKWYLALLAYNAGEGRLNMAIKEAGTDDLAVLIDPDKKYLPLETRTFIKKILAVAKIASRGDIIANEPFLLNRANSMGVVRVDVDGGTPIKKVAQAIGYADLGRLNHHLKKGITPPKERYYIYIPAEFKAKFEESFEGKHRVAMATENADI